MNNLSQLSCLNADNKLKLNNKEINELGKCLSIQWFLSIKGELEVEYSFKQYMQSIEFVTRVAECAEKENHHPTLTIGYKKVKASIFTHDIGAITKADFILAEKINIIFNSV